MRNDKKASVLLAAVNSQSVHTNPALYALTRAAEATGCGELVQTAEYSVTLSALLVLADIWRRQLRVVAFSTYIWNIEYLRPLICDLRRLRPELAIYLGGPEASARAADYLAQLPIDGIFIGEGEVSFPAWLTAYANGQEQQPIPGLLRRGQAASFQAAPRTDLARQPFLYQDTDIERSRQAKRILYYEASRGCPYSCSFCASASEPLRERPLELVLSELPRLAELNGQVKFIDRTFNAAPQRAQAILRRLLELYRPGLSWHCELNPFRLSQELTELFLQAPPDYFHLEVGVQTLNPQALQAVGRHGDWQEAEPAVKRLLEAGNCQVHLDLIAGLPLDTPEEFSRSFHRLHQLNADYLQLGFLKVLPGSILAKKAQSYGLIWEPAPPYRILATPAMSPDYLLALFRAERMFNALYNRSREFRPRLLAEAQKRGDALSLYYQAAALHPAPTGLSQPEKQALVDEICVGA